MDENGLLTILGIRMLNDIFIENKNEWNLVARKAKYYLKQSYGLEASDIQNFLNKI